MTRMPKAQRVGKKDKSYLSRFVDLNFFISGVRSASGVAVVVGGQQHRRPVSNDTRYGQGRPRDLDNGVTVPVSSASVGSKLAVIYNKRGRA
jgi:hypothetical protein